MGVSFGRWRQVSWATRTSATEAPADGAWDMVTTSCAMGLGAVLLCLGLALLRSQSPELQKVCTWHRVIMSGMLCLTLLHVATLFSGRHLLAPTEAGLPGGPGGLVRQDPPGPLWEDPPATDAGAAGPAADGAEGGPVDGAEAPPEPVPRGTGLEDRRPRAPRPPARGCGRGPWVTPQDEQDTA